MTSLLVWEVDFPLPFGFSRRLASGIGFNTLSLPYLGEPSLGLGPLLLQLWLDSLPPYLEVQSGAYFLQYPQEGVMALNWTGIANSSEYSFLSIMNLSSTPMNFA